MAAIFKVAHENEKHIHINAYIGDRLIGTVIFQTDKFPDQWDEFVDGVLVTATPPGLPPQGIE